MKAPRRARMPQATDPSGMVRIAGGTFPMGSDRRYPEAAPAHHVTVSAFWMDPHPVTHAREPLRTARRVMKVGSYLCAPNCCHHYRPARMVQAIDTATCDLGSRCIVHSDGPWP
jgi:formylglycine-generating enzyme required for sulfatase activity